MSKLTNKEAQEVIEKEKQERVKRCGEKIQKALKEEDCDLDVSVLVTVKGNFPQLNIVAK